MFKLVFDFCVPSQKCIKDWRYGKSRNSTATAPGDHCRQMVFDDKMINFQHIWLKFSQLIKNLLFSNSYKICQHSLISIDFIASVLERFDNLSYITFIHYENYYGTLPIIMVLWQKLWNHTKTMKLWFTIEKNYSTLEKTVTII